MPPWQLKESALKKYPHFDSYISAPDAEAYATDPMRVATHAFFPFLLFNSHFTKFAKKGEKSRTKDRPLRYAARRDAYIFSCYRHQLSELYEAKIKELGLGSSILAYRSIPVGPRQGGKCNIHFAADAFEKIRQTGNCCAIALDISSYFESLDHGLLKSLWARLLNKSALPKDHFKVFQAITKYAVVEKKAVYERLGFFGVKRYAKNGTPILGYKTHYKKVPNQLCSGHDFQKKIAGGDGSKSLIQQNRKPYGIPQGAPISDLLANLYLLDFDVAIAKRIQELGGKYYRYSDDILIVVPGDEPLGWEIMSRTRSLIRDFGAKLSIKEEKSSLFVFTQTDGAQTFTLRHGTQGKNGLQFLGFRYDGKYVYIRDNTLSNLYRKITSSARREARAIATRYPDKDLSELKTRFNYEAFLKKFGKVEDFDAASGEYKNWTFWTYATRSSKIFGPLGKPILKQLRNYKTNVKRKIDQQLQSAVLWRSKRS